MRRVRWGRLSELDRRFRIGSPGYNAYPARLKHLHAWRTMHAVADHLSAQMSGTRHGYRPSSNLPIKLKERFIKRRSS